MKSEMNGAVSYLALQKLTEQAWDEGDFDRLLMLTAAVDAATLDCLKQEMTRYQVI